MDIGVPHKHLKKVGIQQKQQVVLLMPIMVLRYIIDPRHLIIVIIGYAVSRTSRRFSKIKLTNQIIGDFISEF